MLELHMPNGTKRYTHTPTHLSTPHIVSLTRAMMRADMKRSGTSGSARVTV